MLKLRPDIVNEVEVFPLDVDGLNMNIVNVTSIVDCLSEQQSLVSYFKDNKNVKKIDKYIFKTELLANVMLFKIPQLSSTFLEQTNFTPQSKSTI